MYLRMPVTMLIVGWVAMLPAQATRVRVVTPSEQPIFQDQDPEPKEVKELAAAAGRVFATEELWSGGDTYRTVYFRGNASDINRMLQRYAAMREAQPPEGVAGVVVRDDGFPDAQEVMRRLYRDAGEMPSFDYWVGIYSNIQPGHPDSGRRVTVNVYIHVCISDRISIEDLEIPPNLHVQVISRLNQFADLHETTRLGSRRAMLEQQLRDIQKELRRLERLGATSRPEGQTMPTR